MTVRRVVFEQLFIMIPLIFLVFSKTYLSLQVFLVVGRCSTLPSNQPICDTLLGKVKQLRSIAIRL